MKRNTFYVAPDWMIKLSLALSIIFLVEIFYPYRAWSKEDSECSTVLQNIQNESAFLNSALRSIDSLLKGKTAGEVPLTEMFQVELKDEEAIATRILELTPLTSEEGILKQAEYSIFKRCFSDAHHLEILDQTAKKQVQFNSKRLAFLKLDKSERESLIATFESNSQKITDRQRIEKQLSDSEESLNRAQTNLDNIANDSDSNAFDFNEGLIAERTILEKLLVDVETEHIKFIEEIKKERKHLDELRTLLTQHIKIKVSRNEVQTELASVDSIWRSSAESLLNTFTRIDISSSFTLPDLVKEPTTNEDIRVLYSEYSALHHKVRLRLLELTEQKNNLLIDLKAQNFRLVNDSGQLRSTLINQCDKLESCKEFKGLNERTLTGIVTEVRILPLRLLAGGFSKFVELQTKVSGGIDGWIDISRQLLILIFLIILPLLVQKSLHWLSLKLDLVREKTLSRSILDYRRRTQVGFWISRLNPFVPSLGMVASVHIARSLIETTDFLELSYLLFYLEMYFLYRATRLLLRASMEILFSPKAISATNNLSERTERSARRLSRFFFIRYLLLHIIEDTVRRSLVYGIAYEVLTWASLIVVGNEIRHWQGDVAQAFEARFRKVWTQVRPLTENYFRFVTLPVMLLLVIGHDGIKLVAKRLIKIDFFKRLVSEVFKKKLEQTSDSSKTFKKPDSDYLAVFDYYLPAKQEFYIDREPLMAKKILNSIDNWLHNKSTEDLVILVGNRGIGKTTSVKMIFDTIDTDHKRFCWVEPKICTADDFFRWLSSLLNQEISSIGDFIKMESVLEKKLVLVIDDVHNLFVGKIGGFSAYRLLMDIVSLRTTKIFWCLTSNIHSWCYLGGVLGKEHFYGQVYEMRMWTDAEIQSLILTRHNMTTYSRSFDKSIAAYGAGNVLGEQVETQFFRLLWGQSRGNPRSALMYWISAVSQTNKSDIHVGVPKFIDSGIVGVMSSEALIIFAALARHDSLTMKELSDVTSINNLVIRKVIKESLEKELVWADNMDRIRISSRAQNTIDYYLVGKNFLYE